MDRVSTELRIDGQLVTVEPVKFGDGTTRYKMSAVFDFGVADVWSTNEAADSVMGLVGSRLGTPVRLLFEARAKQGKVGLHLMWVEATAAAPVKT